MIMEKKKIIQLTQRQINILSSVIGMAEGYLHEMDSNCGKLFGWNSNPVDVISEYIKEVREIKKKFDKRRVLNNLPQTK